MSGFVCMNEAIETIVPTQTGIRKIYASYVYSRVKIWNRNCFCRIIEL